VGKWWEQLLLDELDSLLGHPHPRGGIGYGGLGTQQGADEELEQEEDELLLEHELSEDEEEDGH
jgi:hypothetical protein